MKGTGRKKKKSSKDKDVFLCGPFFRNAVILSVMLLLVGYVVLPFAGHEEPDKLTKRQSAADPNKIVTHHEFNKLPLAHFPVVSEAMNHADLVALYFAASWCPMSTPVTQQLNDIFSGEQQQENLLPSNIESWKEHDRFPLGIVYVSSDKDEEEMKSYLKPGWIPLPFHTNERTLLKKHFRTCAKVELPILDIQRKFELPTIIILDSTTQGVLSTDGVSDLTEYGKETLEHWQDLLSLARAAEKKFT
eukprot:CAMPEP_0118704642 /NCGR_PEP_ID=MMETSP0800-20121206/19356_1 /TAXON_ID=210618 ORGANISM="Striatella unipunctata, Strain CCMP2910" /NCGR_SAMPLE_ID=MMETSP0800 /ASSEMBLY_ACC=CAM_ASM_000638 /LENGTH=246 /DNA_ID=CAMNT_0006606569 /DNA_START=6 /DNA_END=746 /DNA_ORIENTATION=+